MSTLPKPEVPLYTGKDLKAWLDKLAEHITDHGLTSLTPLMFLLSIKGKPYSLEKHYMFAPVFDLARPKEFLLKCARQVGKSKNLMGNNTLQSICVPYLKTLAVTPLFSQAKRLNDDGVRPLIVDTPFKECFDSGKCVHGALRHTYKSNSEQLFSYAFTSCDRIRGISDIAHTIIDEVQDMNPDFIPIIGETMSANESTLGFYTYSGTPLTLDNNIQMLWERSSQGEWTIPCSGCRKENISTVGEDLLKMIGPEGIICAKCGKALESSDGYYLHKYPDFLSTFKSLHISQIIHPLHYRNKQKWQDILRKQKVYSNSQFLNEVCGESCDSAAMPITQSELLDACSQDPADDNTIERALFKRKQSYLTFVGIDWGGGGAEAQSTTVVTFGRQIPNTPNVEILYMERFPTSWSPDQEIKKAVWLIRQFRPNFVAHDYGGGGNLRESMLVKEGINPDNLAPFTYDFAPRSNVIRCHSPGKGSRATYLIDKTRSLKVLFALVKGGKVTFPHREKCWETLKDFLNVGEERTETPRHSDLILLHRKSGRTDDALHAVNFLVSGMCYVQQAYPQLSGKSESTHDDLDEVEPTNPDWEK